MRPPSSSASSARLVVLEVCCACRLAMLGLGLVRRLVRGPVTTARVSTRPSRRGIVCGAGLISAASSASSAGSTSALDSRRRRQRELRLVAGSVASRERRLVEPRCRRVGRASADRAPAGTRPSAAARRASAPRRACSSLPGAIAGARGVAAMRSRRRHGVSARARRVRGPCSGLGSGVPASVDRCFGGLIGLGRTGSSSPRSALLRSRIAPPMCSSFSIVCWSTRDCFLMSRIPLLILLRSLGQLVGPQEQERDDQDHEDLAAAHAKHRGAA